jgi:hypothetical protein
MNMMKSIDYHSIICVAERIWEEPDGKSFEALCLVRADSCLKDKIKPMSRGMGLTSFFMKMVVTDKNLHSPQPSSFMTSLVKRTCKSHAGLSWKQFHIKSYKWMCNCKTSKLHSIESCLIGSTIAHKILDLKSYAFRFMSSLSLFENMRLTIHSI